MSELEYWTKQIKAGKISRREFMGRAAALGVTTAMATTLLSREGIGAEPKKGGFAKFGLAHGATTDTGDPAAYPDTGTQVPFWGGMSNSLTEVDAKGNVVPDLAESFESSDKASKWVFKLRKGSTFHNGKDVTPDDVIASFRHHMGPDSKSAVKSVLAQVKDMKADGHGVVFTLEGGNADFPYLASDYHIPIMPAKDGKADWQSNVRTGPFTFVSWEPGVRARLKRNPNYFKNNKPYLDEVECISITDVTARTNALKTGEVDWIGRPDLATLNLLKKEKGINVTEVTGYGHYVFSMDTTAKPFDNNDVRLAMKWAIDREEISKKIFFGHAAPANDSPIAPKVKFFHDPTPKHKFDPEKAKFYLKKAGLSSLKVDLSVSDAAFPNCVKAGELYQQSAKKCGIDINLVREPSDGYFDNVWLKKSFAADYWSGRPTADWMLTVVYAKGASWNETKWANEKFNQLLVAARSETDEKKRGELYAECQQLIHDDCGQIVIVFNNYVEAASTKLAHGDIAANWECDGLKILERWWKA